MFLIPTFLNATLITWASQAISNLTLTSMHSQLKLLSSDAHYYEWTYKIHQDLSKTTENIIRDNVKLFKKTSKSDLEVMRFTKSTLTEIELQFVSTALKTLNEMDTLPAITEKNQTVKARAVLEKR